MSILRLSLFLGALLIITPITTQAASSQPQPCRAGLFLLLRCDAANTIGNPRELFLACMRCCVEHTGGFVADPGQCQLERRRECQGVCQVRYDQLRPATDKISADTLIEDDLMIEMILSGEF